MIQANAKFSSEPPSSLNTPVLFLIFNRPETTEQVFSAIRKAEPPRLYVAADGPRPDYTCLLYTSDAADE